MEKGREKEGDGRRERGKEGMEGQREGRVNLDLWQSI